jgi:hypothetical protein
VLRARNGGSWDQHDFQLGSLTHATREASGQGGSGQKLVLDIERAFRVIDHVEEQRLDFADLFAIFIRHQCARDSDIDAAKIRPDLVWPRIANGT